MSKNGFPKIYCYLIKNMMLEFYPCSEEILMYFPQKQKRIEYCLDLIYQIVEIPLYSQF